MSYTVRLTEDAERDLEELYDYIAHNDSPVNADHVLSKFEELFSSLSESPERGTYPKELLSLGIREFRTIYFKSYRVIYKVFKKIIYIYLIADGRRDMQSLLERRLLSTEYAMMNQ